MRFELGISGIIIVLVGVGALSLAVYVSGMRAGYDIARQSQTNGEKYTVNYPVTISPPPAAAASLTAQAPAPAAAATQNGLAEGAIPPAPAQAPAARRASAPTLASNAKPPVVRPQPARAMDETAGAPEVAPPEEEPAAAPAPPPPRYYGRKPFNIEIQAAMDSTSATQMIRRLQALGYQPHIAPTQLNGATWYKVEVGPYATQEEAAAAETQLRERYNATYGHGGEPAQPAADDPDE